MRTDQLTKLMGRPAEVSPMPATGQYPTALLKGEIVKAGVGLAICVGIAGLVQPSPWLGWPLVIIGGLFGAYMVQQASRRTLRFSVDDVGVTRISGGQRKPFRWNELDDLRLNYYPNGRKASSGTLVLVLRKGRDRVKIDSTLDQFPTLLSRAAQAARDRKMVLHPTTEANLALLDL